MASSLRKKLAKRQASPDLTRADSDREESSTGSTSSLEHTKPKLTQTDQCLPPIAHDDLGTAPPPPPSHKSGSSNGKLPRNVSPPQSLLDKYKERAARAFVPTASPVKATNTKENKKTGKNTAFSEDFDQTSPATSSEWIHVPETPKRDVKKKTQVHDGVEFEMMGKKGQAGEAPVASAGDDDFVYERRHTRSRSRKQQRADSHDSNVSQKESTKSDSLVPPGLSIRKVSDKETSRTPPPRADTGQKEHGAKGVAPTPANSPRIPSISPRSSSPLLGDPSKTTAVSGLSNAPNNTGVPTFTLPDRRKASDPLAPLKDTFSFTPVIPPPFDPHVAGGYQWISHLGSTSRPTEPWGPMKTWTCCRCSHLDPAGRGRPAETMVEQRVCARVTCAHDRCASCRMTRDSRFGTPGVFSN